VPAAAAVHITSSVSAVIERMGGDPSRVLS
jgi:hypothetical protein